MDSLNLPVIKGEMLPPSERSLDEIDAWIEHDYRLFFDREAYDREKKLMACLVPFSL